jgi:hypothetical protein
LENCSPETGYDHESLPNFAYDYGVAKTWPHSQVPTYLPTRVFSVFRKSQLLLILFRNVLSETFIARNKPAGILRKQNAQKGGHSVFQNGNGHF